MDINKTKYLPTTVMFNSHDPSLSAVSLALHVTVVVPTGYKSPDITTLPRLSSHTMVVMSPSTVSLAVGNSDTLASAIPDSTVTTVFGHKTVGGSLSVSGKTRKLLIFDFRPKWTLIKQNTYNNCDVKFT